MQPATFRHFEMFISIYYFYANEQVFFQIMTNLLRTVLIALKLQMEQ